MTLARLRILFLHQNFPGQFVHLAEALAGQGHEVTALRIAGRPVPGVACERYEVPSFGAASSVPLARELETKLARATACALAMQRMKAKGFEPDLIVAHPGWGEAMFCKDVWPGAKLLVFSEFFYHANGGDYGFDQEFAADTPVQRSRLRMKNTVLLHGLLDADAAYAPTHWQYSRIPAEYRHKASVLFDGIDTSALCPKSDARFEVPGTTRSLTAGDEVLTFVNRNLEPYRGFHVFMRALPEILRTRPAAQCVIVGGDDVSYGQKPSDGRSWREVMLEEVGHRLPLDRVHFVGRLPYANYIQVLQISRCHVYLTYPFVLGWSCIEALSAGCMVVGSDTAPVREVITHGVNGLLVDFFEPAQLGSQVAEVLASPPGRYAQMRTAARNRAVAQYDLVTRCLPAQLATVASLCDA